MALIAGFKQIGFLIAVLLVAGHATAKEITVGGQVRPRFEFRDPVAGSHDTFISMRVRAQVKASLERDVTVLVQLQDVRLWGGETNTLGDYSADHLDLHQGYFELGRLGDGQIGVRVGRQEIAFGGQRLIGAVGWTQQGRAFDGVRMMLAPESGKVDLIAIRLGDATGARVNQDAYLAGAYGQIMKMEKAALDLYTFYNRVSGGSTNQWTLGARLVGKPGGMAYRVEGSYQTGERGGQDVAAFMFGGRVGISVSEGKGQITLWYDYLSGDDAPGDGETKVFDTLFATNHKFYGFADLFLSIPNHTGGLGLQDLALKTKFAPQKGVSLGVNLHAFRTARKGSLTTSRLGEEVDVTLSYKYSSEVTFVGGFSYIVAKDGLAQINRATQDVKWGYVMTNVAF